MDDIKLFNKDEKRLKRDPNIELLRIIGAFIVVIVHTNLSAYIGGKVDYSRVLLKCFASDGVAIFWIITGCFYFNNRNWLHLMKKTLKSIVFPTMLLLIFWQFIGTQFLLEHHTIAESLKVGLEHIGNLKNVLLELNTKYISHIGYLWYMFVYFLLMLFFPFFKGVSTITNKEKNILLILISGVFFLNDLHANQLMQFSHHTINGMLPAVMICLIGERIYCKKECFQKLIWTIVGALGFILVNVIRSFVQYNFYIVEESNYFIYWYAGMGVLAASAMTIFCLSLPLEKYRKIINWGGEKTLGIYLIHIIVRDFLDGYNIKDKLYSSFNMDSAGILKEFVFTIFYALIVVSVSLILLILIEKIKNVVAVLIKSQFIKKCQ